MTAGEEVDVGVSGQRVQYASFSNRAKTETEERERWDIYCFWPPGMCKDTVAPRVCIRVLAPPRVHLGVPIYRSVCSSWQGRGKEGNEWDGVAEWQQCRSKLATNCQQHGADLALALTLCVFYFFCRVDVAVDVDSACRSRVPRRATILSLVFSHFPCRVFLTFALSLCTRTRQHDGPNKPTTCRPHRPPSTISHHAALVAR